MRISSSIVFLVFIWVASTSALALDGAAHGECVGDIHQVMASGYYIAEDDSDAVGVIFKCEAVGSCEPSFFYPETPLPIEVPEDPDYIPRYQVEFSIVPLLDGFAYRYTPYGVREDGSLIPTWHHCDSDSRPYALVKCEDVPIARGTLEIKYFDNGTVYLGLEPCEGECGWEEFWEVWSAEEFAALTGGEVGAYIGQAIDLYGERTYCSMPGGPRYQFSRVAFSEPGGCGTVAVQSKNWGSLKALYR